MISPKTLRDTLTDKHRTLSERLERVNHDRMRVAGPVAADFEEQAVEVQNDEVIDRIASATESELAQITRALARLDAGKFGVCECCGADIGAARLRAAPEATLCTVCAMNPTTR